jgi:hypothetical protein
MIQQMELQIALFREFKRPVIIVQGAADKGQVFIFISIFCLFYIYSLDEPILQPLNLFDGTATMHLEYSPATTIGAKIRRPGNHTHRLVTHYSANGEVIGPKADEFFPNRYYY